MTEVPLPLMPEPPEDKPARPGAQMKVTTVVARHLCQECCRQIHVMGMADAPFPRMARFRVTMTNDYVIDLCHRHKDQWLE